MTQQPVPEDARVEKLRQQADFFPETPGVYLFLKREKPVYIGKAKSLRKRILSYFRPSNSEPHKISGILGEADQLKYILVSSEKEALLLESNLIFEYKPRFNVMLKDNRFYPYIHLTEEEFPRLLVVRNRKGEGRFFGPFTSAYMVRQVLDLLYRSYGIRPCDYDLKKVSKPCLEYSLGRCSAPCGKVSVEEYGDKVEEVASFLEGDVDSLRELLEQKMEFLSRNWMFEKAGAIRDLLKNLDALFSPQYVVLPQNKNQDFFCLDLSEEKAVVMRMKMGRIFALLSLDVPLEMDLQEFFAQFYFGRHNDLPDSIILDEGVRLSTSVQELTGVQFVGKPRSEGEKNVLQIARTNLQKEVLHRRVSRDSLKQLQVQLGLKKFPKRIEGIDIAHTQGLYTVASVVCFENGVPQKSDYRRYRITSLQAPDDFESMRIVTRRRFSKHPLPDLLLIDGGEGQVSAVKGVLEGELDCSEYQMIGLAKAQETIIFPDERPPLQLPHESPALRVLVAVRDESHRFANTYHSFLRDKRMGQSRLEDIPGVGKVRKLRLLKHFGSMERISRASEEEIAQVVHEKNLAKEIKAFLEKTMSS
ncbi:MAG TPA: excinuclease ABC subunit UvrC [Thermotogota bacterium]|nr:excinuclease ABC subunit UvrC [Thermotogota bacterium]HRW92433.1 excinuclease ABC subunit UvrC [Thermotogota bacterium]